MIKIITETDPRPHTVNSLLFKYFNAETERWHERSLSVKGLVQARKSGNNCEWAFFFHRWHTDFLFTYDIRIPDEITITIQNKKGE